MVRAKFYFEIHLVLPFKNQTIQYPNRPLPFEKQHDWFSSPPITMINQRNTNNLLYFLDMMRTSSCSASSVSTRRTCPVSILPWTQFLKTIGIVRIARTTRRRLFRFQSHFFPADPRSHIFTIFWSPAVGALQRRSEYRPFKYRKH